jgi:hypothetical protein
MAEADFLNPDDFPIVTADGAYLNFDDGYVSLILYQNRVLPPKNDIKSKPTLKREIVIDARLSIPTLKHIMMSAHDGLKNHTYYRMVEGHSAQWIDTTFADEHLTDETISYNINELEEDKEEILTGYFVESLQIVNAEGKKEIINLFEKFISDNLEQIKNIRIKYPKEKGEKNVSKTT